GGGSCGGRGGPPGPSGRGSVAVKPGPGAKPGQKRDHDERTPRGGTRFERTRAERDPHADRGADRNPFRPVAGEVLLHASARTSARSRVHTRERTAAGDPQVERGIRSAAGATADPGDFVFPVSGGVRGVRKARAAGTAHHKILE